MKKQARLFITFLISCSLFASSCSGITSNEDSTYQVDTEQTGKPRDAEPFETALNLIQPPAYTNISDLSVEPEMIVSLIAQDGDSPYWTTVEEGAQKAVDDINENLGLSGGDKLTLNFEAPSEEGNVEEQVNLLDEEAALYPLAIGISSADTDAFEVQLDLAIENGIPIVAFESVTNYANTSATIGSDTTALCNMLLTNLVDQIGSTAKVLLITNDSTTGSNINLLETIDTQLAADYPHMQIVETIALDDLNALKEQIMNEENYGIVEEGQISMEDVSDEDVIAYFLENHSDITGFITTDATSNSFLISALDTAKRDYDYFTILSLGADSDQVESLENGKIEGLVLENPFGTGYATVVAALRASLGLANESFINTGITYVTQENLEEPEIQHLLYN